MDQPTRLPDTTPRAAVLMARFLSAVGEGAARELAILTGLEDVLTEMVDRGRKAWPALGLTNDEFLNHLAARLSSAPDAPRALLAVHAEDLWLACACTKGQTEAIAEVEARHFSSAAAAVIKSGASKQLCDDVMQSLRDKLFVRDGDREPRIAQYSGRGSLGGWVRMAALRSTVSMHRSAKRNSSPPGVEDRILEIPAGDLDPELAQMKVTYRAEFKSAFHDAVSALPARDRNVLRLHFLEGLNIDEIGAIYHVHRATVARWVGRAKDQLFDETRRTMTERLRLSHSEFDSLMGLVRSQLDVSLVRLLNKEKGQ